MLAMSHTSRAPARRPWAVLGAVAALCAPVLPFVALTAQPAAAAVGQITTYPGISGASAIAAGSDGALWFTNSRNNSIGRITTAGAATGFNAPGIDGPSQLTPGPDGALWFSNGNGSAGSIGRISTAGVVTIVATLPSGAFAPGLTAGPDGAMWITTTTNMVERITTSGAVTTFPTGLSGLGRITSASDGALWFATGPNGISRITTTGAVTTFTSTNISHPSGITSGPDGAVWFTTWASGSVPASIGRLTTAGVFSFYPVPTSLPGEIVSGPDGALWFTDIEANRIGRISTVGAVTMYSAGRTVTDGITSGPDGALWFSGDTAVGRMTTGGTATFFSGTTSYPLGVVTGPDGAIWMTDPGRGAIVRRTTAGVVTTFTDPNIAPVDITVGPDKALWFTNVVTDGFSGGVGWIGRITTSGVITTFGQSNAYLPGSIVAGRDGALWFTAPAPPAQPCASCPGPGPDQIGRITTAGSVSLFNGTGISNPYGIAVGSDGNIWFTNHNNNSIGRARLITATPTPVVLVSNYTGTGITQPDGITSGWDGALWFVNDGNGSIGRITTSGGSVSSFGAGRASGSIAVGADHYLWFPDGNGIGRMGTGGTLTRFLAPPDEVEAVGITRGPDNAMWFTSPYVNSYGRISTS